MHELINCYQRLKRLVQCLISSSAQEILGEVFDNDFVIVILEVAVLYQNFAFVSTEVVAGSLAVLLQGGEEFLDRDLGRLFVFVFTAFTRACDYAQRLDYFFERVLLLGPSGDQRAQGVLVECPGCVRINVANHVFDLALRRVHVQTPNDGTKVLR